MGQLSLQCTSSNILSSNTSRNSVGSTTANNNLGAWSTLDGDLLSTLTPMLQSHVTSALGVDLVDEGRKVIAKSMEEKGNDNKKPVITIHQVRWIVCVIYFIHVYLWRGVRMHILLIILRASNIHSSSPLFSQLMIINYSG